ncbi:MAG: outer membrane lipoprotein LolB [Planctomycetota bacterium]|jgi:outer membrane lipoprotein LolB
MARKPTVAKSHAAVYPLDQTLTHPWIHSWPILLAALLASGCSQLPVPGDSRQAPSQWENNQLALQQLTKWDMRARSIVVLEREVYHVGISWRRAEDDFMLLLEAPFGQGVFQLESVTGSATPYRLKLPDGQVIAGASAEQLLEDLLGWMIPVSGLEYWIRGLAQPGIEFSHRLNAQGELVSLNQNGWVIRYGDYFLQENSLPLPRKLELQRDNLTIKLVVERWQKPTVANDNTDLFPEFN